MADTQPRKGSDTRTRILELAEAAVLEKGFAATSIDELIAGVGITKSGFFYHFKDKHDLARQLVERHAAESEAFLEQMAARARELSDDPLHSFLIFLISTAVLFGVSYVTAPPDYGRIQGLTYGTETAEERAASRASWGAAEVLASLGVLVAIVAAYLYFTG